MTVQLGDTGKVAYGTLKTFTTTLATPRETLLGTPVSLPSTEPGTSQISITVQDSDLPTFTGVKPLSLNYTAQFFAAGKNTDAATQTVSWRILKNGVSLGTGTHSSIATNTFWTHSYGQANSLLSGDVIEIRLWSPSANVNYDYFALIVYPDMPKLTSSFIVKDVAYSNIISTSLVSGTASVQQTASAVVVVNDAGSNIGMSSNMKFGALSWFTSGSNAQKVWFGSVNTLTTTNTHATARPFYPRNSLATTIIFREVLR